MFTGPKTAKTQTATSSGRFTKFATSDPLFQCCRYQNRTRSRCVVPAALMYSIVTLNLWSYTKQICANKLATSSPDQFVILSFPNKLFAFHALPFCPLTFQKNLKCFSSPPIFPSDSWCIVHCEANASLHPIRLTCFLWNIQTYHKSKEASRDDTLLHARLHKTRSAERST